MSDNVSKSVSRAFAVFELFRACRRPLTAAAMQRELDVPQPSLRALLVKLVELGYLSLDEATRAYFPTARFGALGQVVSGVAPLDSRWRSVVDGLTAESGETCSLCVATDFDLEVLYACQASHPVALRLQAGQGDALWRSVAGRLLLSTRPSAERAAAIARWRNAAESSRARHELDGLETELVRIRKRGWYAAYDLHLKGVGAVGVLTRHGEAPAVLSVAGVSERIRGRERALRRLLRDALPEV